MRVKITLRCNECKQRNYNTMKNKKNDPDRLEMKKYCRFCKKQTVNSETKYGNGKDIAERVKSWQKQKRKTSLCVPGSESAVGSAK